MYYFVYGFLYLLSLLPLKVLFVLSDFVYLIMYHLAGYRKKVVLENLSRAFPHITDRERKAIAKKFYRNFCDNLIETVKLISAGEKFMNRHFMTDYSIFHELLRQGKKCHVHLGHNFNWELAGMAGAANIEQQFLTVYMPVTSKIIDRLLLKIRSRTGAVLLPATDLGRSLMRWRRQPYVLTLVADQSPAGPDHVYWIRFFGRPTAFLKAPENGARIANLPVIFYHFTKSKRGYYKGHLVLAEENPAALPRGELTLRFARHLEETISRDPDLWLWSHRRWKHEWKEEYGEVLGEMPVTGNQ